MAEKSSVKLAQKGEKFIHGGALDVVSWHPQPMRSRHTACPQALNRVIPAPFAVNHKNSPLNAGSGAVDGDHTRLSRSTADKHMTIVRYEPWSLVDRLTRQFETARPAAWIPSVDVREEAERYVVRADLPGVSPDDIEVTADAGVLTIKGERKAGTQQAENTYQRVERVAGNFVRRFTLPEAAQTDAIKATHVNGVLELSIPKQAKPEVRRIKVEAA